MLVLGYVYVSVPLVLLDDVMYGYFLLDQLLLI